MTARPVYANCPPPRLPSCCAPAGGAAPRRRARAARNLPPATCPGSLHIPLGELPQRLGEIPPGSAPVFICRVGGRSMAACQLALRARIASPANLEGGLLAWSREVDPALTVL